MKKTYPLQIGNTKRNPVVLMKDGKEIKEKKLTGEYVEVFPTFETVPLIQMLDRHAPAFAPGGGRAFKPSPLLVPKSEAERHASEPFKSDTRYEKAAEWRAGLPFKELPTGRKVPGDAVLSDAERFHPAHIFQA